jgi:hypothetical protein
MPKHQAPRSWAKTRVTEPPARARWPRAAAAMLVAILSFQPARSACGGYPVISACTMAWQKPTCFDGIHRWSVEVADGGPVGGIKASEDARRIRHLHQQCGSLSIGWQHVWHDDATGVAVVLRHKQGVVSMQGYWLTGGVPVHSHSCVFAPPV